MNILIRYIFALFYKYFIFFKERRFVKMKNFSSKGIRFSEDSIKSCVGFIDLVDSPKNTITMDNLAHMREYYSKLINSISDEINDMEEKL